MSASPDTVRREVRDSYGKAIENSGSCCASSCCGGAATLPAGYTDEDRAVLADGVVSFGCGNPLAFSEVGEGETVVDLGSGAGFDLLLASQRVGPTGKVIGVDMTDEMIDRARANLDRAGAGNVEVRKGLIEDLPVEAGTVDWVVSNCVINLSPEKDRVFAEIARVLKPGGRMLVSDIVADDLPDFVRRIKGSVAGCIGGAVGEQEYLAGLRRAGLEAVEVRDRVVYDARTLVALGADQFPLLRALEALPAALRDPLMGFVDGLGAKVQSIRVFARKPG
ncbi:MAG: arsenite methyltransferase [Candidatus Sericytochromatia bacterium]|nr:arsenite methyltransferase [Candidatus Tanganyikabacteria bacterium]